MITVRDAAVFSNFLALSARVNKVPRSANLVIDLTHTRLVDHSVMGKLQVLQGEFARAGGHLEIRGLDGHQPVSNHPMAARRNRSAGGMSRQPQLGTAS